MDEDKRFVEASWWEGLALGELGLILVGKAMLRKSLIQFLCWWVELCSLPPRPIYSMVTSFKQLMPACHRLQDCCSQYTWPQSRLLSTHASYSYSVQFSPVAQSCPTLCDPMNRITPGLPVHHKLMEFTQTHVHQVGNAIQPSHPLSSPSCPQSLPASGSFPMSQLFAWGAQSIRVSASTSILPMNNPGLISCRMDWLDLLAVQGTLKSLLYHHSSKASIFRHSAFFTVQLSHPYMTTGKTMALTRWTFVGKVMSLLFNMISRLVITFLPRSNCLLISWLQSPSAVILEPTKIKSDTASTVLTIYLPWSDGTRCHDLSFLNVEL